MFKIRLKSGFSLVELTVVLAIIGILASFGVNSYINSQKRGRDNKRQADLEAVRSALEQYRYDAGTYPSGNGWSVLPTLQAGGYMQSLPIDPLSSQSYYYRSINAARAYSLCARFEILPSTAPLPITNCGGSAACGARCSYQVVNP